MNITLITTMAVSPWGGSEELLAELASLLATKNKITISVYNWGELPLKIDQLKDKGIIVQKRKRIAYSSIIGKILGKINQYLFAKQELTNLITNSNADHIIISMGSFSDLRINPLRKFLLTLETPYSLIIHANPEARKIDTSKRIAIKKVCINASKVYFVSARLIQIAERQIAFNFSNAVIVANPVNMQETGILPWPQNNTFQMALVGRLDVSIKGQSLIIQILAQPKWKERSWVLNLYGEGPDIDIIEELILFYGLSKKVKVHGQVHDVRQDIWTKNHILVMPSYYEGLPLALVEAMQSGRTAVATDVGGNTELITNGVDGFIAEGATYYSFDKALESAWLKKEEWESMGEKAYLNANNYVQKYHYTKVFSKFINEKNKK